MRRGGDLLACRNSLSEAAGAIQAIQKVCWIGRYFINDLAAAPALQRGRFVSSAGGFGPPALVWQAACRRRAVGTRKRVRVVTTGGHSFRARPADRRAVWRFHLRTSTATSPVAMVPAGQEGRARAATQQICLASHLGLDEVTDPRRRTHRKRSPAY